MKIKRELSFLTVVSLVIGSQIGAGAFSNPSVLAKFKFIGLFGLFGAAVGAIAIALVFAKLSACFPKSGGPHTYVSEAFGRCAGFFTAWVYWIISWLSNAVLLSMIVGYLTIMLGEISSIEIILIEIFVVLAITYVNIVGVKCSGTIGIVLTMLKLGIFLILPIVFFCFFDIKNFEISSSDFLFDKDGISALCNSVLLGFFGFIGIESATASTERIKNPEKAIPRALIIGTIVVSLVYIVNIIAIIGIVGFDRLAESDAPYAFAIQNIFHNNSPLLIAIVSIIVCVGTLNSWTLTSGQIAYVAYEDGLFPKIFGKLNKSGAPVASLIFAALGMIVCFFIQQTDSLKDGLMKLLNISVSIFIYIYMFCSFAYIKIIKKIEHTKKAQVKGLILGFASILFCLVVLIGDICFESGAQSFFVLAIFVALGLPIWLKTKDSARR